MPPTMRMKNSGPHAVGQNTNCFNFKLSVSITAAPKGCLHTLPLPLSLTTLTLPVSMRLVGAYLKSSCGKFDH